MKKQELIDFVNTHDLYSFNEFEEEISKLYKHEDFDQIYFRYTHVDEFGAECLIVCKCDDGFVGVDGEYLHFKELPSDYCRRIIRAQEYSSINTVGYIPTIDVTSGSELRKPHEEISNETLKENEQ